MTRAEIEAQLSDQWAILNDDTSTDSQKIIAIIAVLQLQNL